MSIKYIPQRDNFSKNKEKFVSSKNQPEEAARNMQREIRRQMEELNKRIERNSSKK